MSLPAFQLGEAAAILPPLDDGEGVGRVWSALFWREVAERAGKSAAQALVGLWALDGFNAVHADYGLAVGVAGGAALLSVLTSIVSAPYGPSGSPSLVAEQDGGSGRHRAG